MRLLAIDGEAGEELRASGALGWGGSRAVKMVRRERVAGGVGVGMRSALGEGVVSVSAG